MQSLEGSSLGGYVLEVLIGRGGMGHVYKAWQESLQRHVALKVLTPEGALHTDLDARLLRELKIHSTLSHPHLVHMYDGGFDKGCWYISMELVEGLPLNQHIQDSAPMPLYFTLAVAGGLVDALIFLHEQGVSHRDLKPANVLVSFDGNPKVVDFGLARDNTNTQITAASQMIGTLRYLAPETVAGKRGGESSDRFALGLILYEMLVGTLPYQGETVPALLLEILTGVPPPISAARPDVPEALSDVVAQLLEKDPDRRPTLESVLRVIERLAVEAGHPRASWAAAVLSHIGVRNKATTAAPRATTPRRTRKTAKVAVPPPVPPPRRLRLLVAGLVLLCLLVAGHWILERRTPPRSLALLDLALIHCRFETEGRIRVSVDGTFPTSGVVTVADAVSGLARERSFDATRTVDFDEVPAGRAFRVMARSGTSGVAAGPILVQTPPRLGLTEVLTTPAHDQVLVVARVEARGPVSVSVTSLMSGIRLKQVEQLVTEGQLRLMVSGLTPTTDYLLDIQSPRAWGGVRRHRFRTLSRAHEKRLAAFLSPEAWRGGPGVALSLIADEVDPRVIPSLLANLPELGTSPVVDLSLAEILRGTLDRRLAQRLHPGLTQVRGPLTRLNLLESLARLGFPGVFEIASTDAASPLSRPDHLVGLAAVIARTGGPNAIGALQKLVDRLPTPDRRVGASLAAADPSPDHQALARWLIRNPSEAVGRDWAAILALGHCKDAAAESILCKSLDSDLDAGGALNAHVTDALSGMRGAISVKSLEAAAARERSSLAACWALLRRGERSVSRGILMRWGQSTAASLRSQAALGYGLMRDPGTVVSVRRLLNDPDSHVRRSAAWAVTRLGDTGSVRDLSKWAERDVDGVMFHALSVVGGPDKHPLLDRVIRGASQNMLEWPGLPLMCWSAAAAGVTSIRDLLTTLAAAPARSRAVRWASKVALDHLAAASRPTVHVLLPYAPYDRPGLSMREGDGMRLEASGYWILPDGEESWVGSGKPFPTVAGRTCSLQLRPVGRLGPHELLLGKDPVQFIADRSGDLEFSPFSGVPFEPASMDASRIGGFALIRVEP